MLGQSLAVCAGLCAALASTCAKLAMASGVAQGFCQGILENLEGYSNSEICKTFATYVRIFFFALIFLFNAVMWTLFVKSLQKCSTTLEATVTNTAANFLFTAVLGRVMFGETLSVMWWMGTSLVIVGLLLINKGSPDSHTKYKQS